MFGDEPKGLYNRIQLSSVLGGFFDPADLWLQPREWYEENGVHIHSGVRVDKIFPQERKVSGRNGIVVEPYDELILATGSRPFVPPIPGKEKRGVFVFRTIEDCQAIGSYAADCDNAVVLGGGLLGLEAARGLLSHDLNVTVVETATHLMPQQLDADAGALLKDKMSAMGLDVVLGERAEELLGDETVTGVRLADDTTIDADLVIICCGIRPNVDEARAAGLRVDKGIVVDDTMLTSEDNIFALGECAQHRGKLYGLVDPLYEQARVLADVLTETNAHARYFGSRLSTTLKVMGVDLSSMGEVHDVSGCQVLTHTETDTGVYKKLVLRENRLVGAVLLGTSDVGGRLSRIFKEDMPVPGSPYELLNGSNGRDALLSSGDDADLCSLPDDTQICNCNEVPKGVIVQAISEGCKTVKDIGKCTKAGTGCGSCQPLLSQLIDGKTSNGKTPKKTKAEDMKEKFNGLDILDEIQPLMVNNEWKKLTPEHKDLIKWQGLFFRKPTPGHFMLRLRLNAGKTNAAQFRVIADLSDEFGKGFCDLTTRQQIQMRWFTLADITEIFGRLEAVGIHSRQTGMDNVRGVCGCPLSGFQDQELFDASQVVDDYTNIILGDREFTNLPRKFNVTITGCLENCCHTETQDVALIPAVNADGQNGFNVTVGGKQGSGGYTPGQSLDVFVAPEEGADVCAELTRIFRDNGNRTRRNRARFAFVVQDKGIHWVRHQLEARMGRSFSKAGRDARTNHHTDHIGIHPQKSPTNGDTQLHYVGFTVPVGRITTAQMRQVADVADKYGTGDIRITVGQNLVIPNIPENRLEELQQEPLFQELPFDPSPIMRGLVACTGNDYCAMALIDTKTYAVEIARELERRTEGQKLKPLTIHWSGCPAGCGLHQVSTIGLQGCRTRIDGKIYDAAHVTINGQAGPEPVVANDLLYDVPVSQLADYLMPLVGHLPRLRKE